MQLKFPKLQSYLIKDSKVKTPKKSKKEGEVEVVNFTNAYVYKGHIIASDAYSLFFFNLKEYLKSNFITEKEETSVEAYDLIQQICDNLEGKLLQKEFFTIFSKYQTITSIDEYKISVETNGFHSEFSIGETYNPEMLVKFLKGQKNIFLKKSPQGDFSVKGTILSAIMGVISSECKNDSLIFQRCTDSHLRFTLEGKDFIFGLCLFSLEGEASITKFGEAEDFLTEL